MCLEGGDGGVPARAEPPHLDVGSLQEGLQLRRGRGRDCDAARRQGADDLRLRLRHPLDGPEELEVHGPDARHEADFGARDLAQSGDLPQSAHAHLGHDDLGLGLDLRERQRQPDLVVVAPFRGDDDGVRRAERGKDVLGGGLARRAGDPDNPRIASRAHGLGIAARAAKASSG